MLIIGFSANSLSCFILFGTQGMYLLTFNIWGFINILYVSIFSLLLVIVSFFLMIFRKSNHQTLSETICMIVAKNTKEFKVENNVVKKKVKMMENETIELTYERATLGRRIAAFLVDAFLSLLTGAIFLLLTFYLLSVSPFMKSIYQQRDDIQLNSHLYLKDDSNHIIQLKESISKDTALTIKEKNKKYDDALTYFFDSNLFLMKMKEMKYIGI